MSHQPKEWRQIKGKDVWHFHRKCQHWPKLPTEFVSRKDKPKSGELCDECRRLAKANK